MITQYLTKWKMSGAMPYTPLRRTSMETGNVFQGVTGLIDATVPGSVHADLLRAGMIEDPYYEMNSLKCEWVSQRWWVYTTSFKLEQRKPGKRYAITFKGLDYKAHIFVNEKLVACHENMYTPVRIDITELANFGDEENKVKVVLEHAPDEMSQIGHTSMTHTQKARFTYMWDFCMRMIHLGIWDDVTVEEDWGSRIVYDHVRYQNQTVTYEADVDGAGKITALLSFYGEKIGEAELEIAPGKNMLTIPVENPQLWYPNGYGEQPLYDLHVLLENDKGICEEKTLQVGLRTLSYQRCDDAIETALPYIPVVNGKRIYIKGVNCTPLDMMYGTVDKACYDKMLRLAKNANVNLIRVWGGGIIEKEAFYELCDQYGIMVWQEFIQSSSGIDNTPSELPEFLENAAKTAEHAVRVKRNHVSLTYWSGGNELFEWTGEPAQYSNKNIAMLKEIANRLDPDRLMLPTSASGPIGWRNDARPQDNHDIHGPWKYPGVEKFYRMYNTSPIQLHSEFGCDGMSNYSALLSCLSPVNRKVTSMMDNLTWRHHGEKWDTLSRDEEIFGQITDLEEFCDLSQYIQAESIRYALEANRRRAFRNCGSIVWQFNEPWPNVTCTNMVDYYYNPKFVYYFYRDAMKSLHVSMRYETILFQEGDVFKGSLFVHDDMETGWDSVSAILKDDQGRVIQEITQQDAFDVTWKIEGTRTFTVECVLKRGDYTDINTYMFFVLNDSNPKADRNAVRNYMRYYKGRECYGV